MRPAAVAPTAAASETATTTTTTTGSAPAARPRELRGLRACVALCQAATVLLTWPLWAARAAPPTLPALAGLPAVGTGPALLATLALALVRPRAGTLAHAAVLAYAVLADQTRLQPYAVSLALLLAATLPSRAARTLGRAHLLALWLWAALHKLASPAFAAVVAPWALAALWPAAPAALARPFAYALIALEAAPALLALAPRTRRAAAWTACVLHGGALLVVLAPWHGRAANAAVAPWNVALAAAAWGLIGALPRAERLVATRSAPARLAALALLAAPAGYYAGVTDAYLAHQLYTEHVPTTLRCDAAMNCAEREETAATMAALGAALPPEPRLFRASFARTCRAGDTLVIADPRPIARWRGRAVVSCACVPAAPAPRCAP